MALMRHAGDCSLLQAPIVSLMRSPAAGQTACAANRDLATQKYVELDNRSNAAAGVFGWAMRRRHEVKLTSL